MPKNREKNILKIFENRQIWMFSVHRSVQRRGVNHIFERGNAIFADYPSPKMWFTPLFWTVSAGTECPEERGNYPSSLDSLE